MALKSRVTVYATYVTFVVGLDQFVGFFSRVLHYAHLSCSLVPKCMSVVSFICR
jgi:hypothetical protein